MRCRAPRIGAPEVTVAEDQPEYRPVTVAVLAFDGEEAQHIVTRWTLTADERERIAAGEDIYVGQLNFGGPMTPLVVGMREMYCTLAEDC